MDFWMSGSHKWHTVLVHSPSNGRNCNAAVR
jgi:hypothetical protein